AVGDTQHFKGDLMTQQQRFLMNFETAHNVVRHVAAPLLVDCEERLRVVVAECETTQTGRQAAVLRLHLPRQGEVPAQETASTSCLKPPETAQQQQQLQHSAVATVAPP
ncbi:MAG: hypothetical protein ACKPKO_63070, partial [Candidatus Fonsibacter sp.]